jgi:hypothetical protein
MVYIIQPLHLMDGFFLFDDSIICGVFPEKIF